MILSTITNKLFNKKNKTLIVPLTSLVLDKEYAGLYNADGQKVQRIVKSLEEIGYDMSQPIIITKDMKPIDGHSRIKSIKLYNELHPESQIREVPCIIKEFDSKEEALLYEVHLNTDRRSLSDGDMLTSFITLNSYKEQLKNEGKETNEYTDKKLSEILNVSERQISKLRYIVKNATDDLREAIINNQCTINNAEAEIKKLLDSGNKEIKQSTKISKNGAYTKLKVNDFMLGIKYTISELKKGNSSIEIWENISKKESILFTDEQLNEINSIVNNL